MNTDEQREQQHAVEARAGTAGVDLAEHDVDERRRAADRREAVVLRVDRAGRRSGRRRREQARRRGPEPGLLALHVAAGLRRGRRLVRADRGELGVAVAPRTTIATSEIASQSTNIALSTAMPCFTSPAIFPNIHGNANGIASSIQISRMFVIGFGFSNGCDGVRVVGAAAVLADLLDRLLARDRTAGDRLRLPGDGRDRACAAWKFWTTPWLTSTSANTNASGSRTRVVVRTRSTQKLPSVCVRRRTRPRISATATAAPAAADTKLCTARPAIWVRCDIVDSPE